ncbi:MAG: response regulator, partial [Candidatus Wallbacteria bacterium]|nr:response regulator [Candidatus Wallbacteria bacterium]
EQMPDRSRISTLLEDLNSNKSQERFSGLLTDIPYHAVRNIEPTRETLLIVFNTPSDSEQFQKSGQDVLALLSHEINTPLTVIYGYLNMLRQEQKPSRPLQIMQSNCLKLQNTVDNLILAAESSSREADPVFERTDLCRFISFVLKKFRPSFKDRQLSISFDRSNFRNCSVFIDRRLFYRLLFNAFDNAVKFCTPGGTVEVQLSEPPGLGPVITIKNDCTTCAGIDQNVIFEPFFQVEETSTRIHSGLGLGLHIIRNIITLHKGSCRVSADDRSFSLEITLPVQNQGPLRVLMADDNEATADIFKRIFRDRQDTLFCAASAYEALDILSREDNIDLVFLDINMPGMSGIEAAREIRKSHPWLRICFLTGLGDAGSAKEAIQAGGSDYIVKPFTLDQIISQLEIRESF